MFRLTAKIEIKSAKTWRFDKVAGVEITRDIDTLTDTCVVTLPKKSPLAGREFHAHQAGRRGIGVAGV